MPHPSVRLQARSAVVAALACVAGAGCWGNLDPVFTKAHNRGAGGSGGAGDGGAGGGAPGTACDDAPMIMKASCGLVDCHEPNSVKGADLDLLSDGVAARLLGMASTGNETEYAKCGAGSVYLVPSTSPAMGLFVDKLTYPTCGDLMPTIGVLSATKRKCLLDWATSLTAAAP